MLIIIIINFLISLYIDIYKIIPSDNIKVIYSGCFTQNKDGYLIKDNESNKIDQLFEYEIDNASKLHYTFISDICGFQKIDFPKFLIAFTKIEKIRDLTYKRFDNDKIYCSIYFIKNQEDSKIDIRVDLNDNIFIDTEHYDRFSSLFTSISKDENINDENLIKSVAKFYVAIAGQSVLQTFLERNQSNFSSRVILDSENLFVSASNFLFQYGNESTKKKINDLRNFWLADLERYKGMIYFQKNQPISTINHYFNALYYDIYYPHETYDEIKYRLITDYDAALDSLDSHESIYSINPTIDLIKNVVISKNNPQLTQVTINRINQLKEKSSDNPLFWYYYGEIIKYCQTDGKKYNLVYEKRITESISAFQKAIELDPTFSLVYAKIGALKFILSELTDDSIQSKQLIEEGKTYMDKDLLLYDLHLEKIIKK